MYTYTYLFTPLYIHTSRYLYHSLPIFYPSISKLSTGNNTFSQACVSKQSRAILGQGRAGKAGQCA